MAPSWNVLGIFNREIIDCLTAYKKGTSLQEMHILRPDRIEITTDDMGVVLSSGRSRAKNDPICLSKEPFCI